MSKYSRNIKISIIAAALTAVLMIYYQHNSLVCIGVLALLLFMIVCLFKQVEDEKRKLETVIGKTSEGFLMLNSDMKVIKVNDSLCEMTGYWREELLGCKITDFLSSESSTIDLKSLLDSGRTQEKYEQVLVSKSGHPIHAFISVTVVRDCSGKPEYIYAFVNDITERKRSEDYMRYMAFHDSLTGLPNRKMFEVRIAEELDTANHQDEKIAVMFIDIDNFKAVNDTFGHDTGDRMICEAASRLKSVLRKGDLICRVGGDEFILLLKEVEGTKDAISAALRIGNVFDRPFIINRWKILIKPSIGISMFPEDGMEPEILIRKADQAMYEAKKTSVNNYRFYSGSAS